MGGGAYAGEGFIRSLLHSLLCARQGEGEPFLQAGSQVNGFAEFGLYCAAIGHTRNTSPLQAFYRQRRCGKRQRVTDDA